ncbi:hypothetical protein H0H87_005053 [Tephrocybe sp. NHM501043]|nr:hypothetical protein H0H87_005053 [Tephrocybe sp. NHM501043]
MGQLRTQDPSQGKKSYIKAHLGNDYHKTTMFSPLRLTARRLPPRTAAGHRALSLSRTLLHPAPRAQSVSPLAPIGVAAALDPSTNAAPRPKILDEFRLTDRVALVSGANRGLGLEMALALAEAGARAVYCADLPAAPSAEFAAARAYAARLPGAPRMEYVRVDVRDQAGMWARAEEIGDEEGRMDVCVAAAGVLRAHTDCLEYPREQFEEVLGVNVNGVLWTAQAAGRQMRRFGRGGSIVLVASMSGSITNKVRSGRGARGTRELIVPRLLLGPRVGVVQLEQVGGAPDGAEHGVRAGPGAD